MSPKELLYLDDALSDPQLKQRVRQLQNAHRQIFNQLMALV